MLTALYGAGAVGLRALATGLPAALLVRPRSARAAACAAPGRAQYLVFSTSYLGDPLNGNVPGTYVHPDLVHPLLPSMEPAEVQIGGQTYTAARPWASLPPELLARTSFFHHATQNVSHGNEPKVLRLMGAIQRQEMLVSLIAGSLAPCLGTVQAAPVSVGAAGPSEYLSYEGRVQPTLTPTSLRDVLLGPQTPLLKLRGLRDRALDALNQLYRRDGTPAQRQLLDRMARSQGELRALSDDLLNSLTTITSNEPDGQVTAALLLIRMKVTPVVSVHIPWGGDNHSDPGLSGEAAQTVAGVGTLVTLQQRLAALGLQDQVSFAAMNVFGRTMSVNRKGTSGRDHLANHHCTVMMGRNLRGSVIGGVEPRGADFAAQAIDSRSGRGGAGGDIPLEDTLGAMGKTLCAALGVDAAVYDDQITTGKAVTAALAR